MTSKGDLSAKLASAGGGIELAGSVYNMHMMIPKAQTGAELDFELAGGAFLLEIVRFTSC